MRFLESIPDAILNRAPEELVGALLLAAAVAIIVAGVYSLGRRKSSPSPTFVGGLGLAAGASCMALAAGYIEYVETAWRTGSPANQSAHARWSPSNSGQVPPPQPWSSFGPGWSPGFHVVVAADENRDGRLTQDEVAGLVRRADTDGDGSVNVRDIDRLISNRFRARVQPGGFDPAGPNARGKGDGWPEQRRLAVSSDDEKPATDLDE